MVEGSGCSVRYPPIIEEAGSFITYDRDRLYHTAHDSDIADRDLSIIATSGLFIRKGGQLGGEVRGREMMAENIAQSGSTDQRGDPANS